MKQITKVRKVVCIIANELKKAGYSLSQAFKRAWNRVKKSTVVRAVGTTFENRQECLKFLKQFKSNDLTVTLERELKNKFSNSAIQIVVHILSISRKTVIGYIPETFAKILSKVLDMGIQAKASLMGIIGGYSYKEMFGALINISL